MPKPPFPPLPKVTGPNAAATLTICHKNWGRYSVRPMQAWELEKGPGWRIQASAPGSPPSRGQPSPPSAPRLAAPRGSGWRGKRRRPWDGSFSCRWKVRGAAGKAAEQTEPLAYFRPAPLARLWALHPGLGLSRGPAASVTVRAPSPAPAALRGTARRARRWAEARRRRADRWHVRWWLG